MTTETIGHLTKEQIADGLAAGFVPGMKVVTCEVSYLVEILTDALFRLQEETEQRVRAEMVKPSLN